MKVENIVKPANDEHSIKEAVIGVILAQPILKPERFKDLIENEYKDKFQQFIDLKQIQFQIKNQEGTIKGNEPEIIDNAGFRFIEFENGKIIKVLQGVNESNRTYISYHSFKYKRWDDFYKQYLDRIIIIANQQKDIFIKALSLHYIDEFIWIANTTVELDKIFNNNNGYLPKKFFNPQSTDYSIVIEIKNNDITYLNRLGIIINRTLKPIITISHNVTIPFTDINNFESLVKSEKFKCLLNSAHKHNKDLLQEILTENICKLIKLNK